MRLLFVPERIGALGGAGANGLATAEGLRQRGHRVGRVHGSAPRHGEPARCAERQTPKAVVFGSGAY